MMEDNKIREIRSEEVQEILSRTPHNLIRGGSTVIGIIICVLFIGSFFFRYPDTVTCKITLTTSNPPTWIIAKAAGKMKELYYNDKQHVKAGNIIAIIENPASTKDVLKLENLLNKIRTNTFVTEEINVENMNLGDIQSSYTSFLKALTQYNNSLLNNLYDEKIKSEEAQLSPYSEYIESIKRQIEISGSQHKLACNNYDREKAIYDRGLTSTSEVESAEQTLLGSRMSAEQIRTSLSNAKVQVAQIKNSINELKIQKEQDRKESETSLCSALEELKNAIRTWQQIYALISPINGTLSYNNIWKANQNVATGDKVFSVVDGKSRHILAKIQVPVSGSGKVKIGQRVNIKLDGYPYLEYGFLTGTIVSIAAMPDSDIYTATVELSSRLVTSYHKRIRMNGDLSGTAEIITDDLSMGERMLNPFRYILKKYTFNY